MSSSEIFVLYPLFVKYDRFPHEANYVAKRNKPVTSKHVKKGYFTVKYIDHITTSVITKQSVL